MFGGQDLSRLMMMIVLLCVVGILFYRARDPRTWKWFARGDADASATVESEEVAAKQLARAETLATTPRPDDALRISPVDKGKTQPTPVAKPADATASEAKDENTDVAKSAPASSDAAKTESKNESTTPAKDPATGDAPIVYKEHVEKSDAQLEAEQKARDAIVTPIDEEFSELQAAKIEFGEVRDNAMNVEKAEMNIYRRLIRWSDAQSYDQLVTRATKKFRYDDFIMRPHENRGKLVKTEMTLVRVVKLEAVKGFEPHEDLYEIWCKTDDSKGYFYECVVAELPKDLIPKDVSLSQLSEKISFVGYFFKVQGYVSGGRERGKAPLLVGRVQWHPRQASAASTASSSDNADYATLWWLFGLGIIFMGYLGLRFWLKSTRVVPARLSDHALDEASFEDWLDSSGSVEPPGGNRSSRNGPTFDWQSDGDNGSDRNDSDNENGESENGEPGEEWKSSYK